MIIREIDSERRKEYGTHLCMYRTVIIMHHREAQAVVQPATCRNDQNWNSTKAAWTSERRNLILDRFQPK